MKVDMKLGGAILFGVGLLIIGIGVVGMMNGDTVTDFLKNSAFGFVFLGLGAAFYAQIFQTRTTRPQGRLPCCQVVGGKFNIYLENVSRGNIVTRLKSSQDWIPHFVSFIQATSCVSGNPKLKKVFYLTSWGFSSSKK